MRFYLYFISWLALTLGLLACDGSPAAVRAGNGGAASTGGADASGPEALTEDGPGNFPDSAASPSPAPRQTGARPPTGGAYRLLGVLDPELDSMVAFALKVPRTWRVEQSFKRRWQGPFPANEVYLKFRAPDGRAQIEYLPYREYTYSKGPMSDEMHGRLVGKEHKLAPNERAPMSGVAYVRQVLLPELAQWGLTLRDVGNEQEVPLKGPPERDENQQVQNRGSVDGLLPNGNRARVECRISLSTRQVIQDTYYAWSAVPSITQTADDLDAAYAHTRVAQESIVRNPAWVKRYQDLQKWALQRAQQPYENPRHWLRDSSAARTAAPNHRRPYAPQPEGAIPGRFFERLTVIDTGQAAFNRRMTLGERPPRHQIDAIREEPKYADPTTGQRVKTADGYNHAYRDRQNPNRTYGASTRIEAGQVNWQELQKLSLKDY